MKPQLSLPLALALVACGGPIETGQTESALSTHCYGGACFDLTLAAGYQATQNGPRVRVRQGSTMKMEYRLDASGGFGPWADASSSVRDCHGNLDGMIGLAVGTDVSVIDDYSFTIDAAGVAFATLEFALEEHPDPPQKPPCCD